MQSTKVRYRTWQDDVKQYFQLVNLLMDVSDDSWESKQARFELHLLPRNMVACS